MTSTETSPIGPALLHGLLVEQFPHWAPLPITALDPATSSDHLLFRVGDELLARLPRRSSAAAQVEKEQSWLPVLGPRLQVRVPTLVARGLPAADYPWPWSIHDWLPGRAATVDTTLHENVARDLGRFVRALQRLDPADGPRPGPHNGGRGAPLATRDTEVRHALSALERMPDPALDLGRAREIWRIALDAPPHHDRPTWIHGDLLPGNVLLDDTGRLGAVIDFGCLGVGDPACDLMAAWTILPADRREDFKRHIDPDHATWARARGWALSFGLIALPYHRTRAPTLAAVAERTIHAVTRDG